MTLLNYLAPPLLPAQVPCIFKLNLLNDLAKGGGGASAPEMKTQLSFKQVFTSESKEITEAQISQAASRLNTRMP